ncbi:hypothetical protein FRC07_004560 [Ceratobasidium sp. 392]|nr:hypothetical protein FRC07_004560 [Ceratobasidium sp. 392]
MPTFTRLLSMITFLLSLSFIAQALPAATEGRALAVREYGIPSYAINPTNGKTPDIMITMSDFKNAIDVELLRLGGATDVAGAKIAVENISRKVKGVVYTIGGKKIPVTNEIKAKVAGKFIEVAKLLVAAFASALVKLGPDSLALFADFDHCFHILFVVISKSIGEGFGQACTGLSANFDNTTLTNIKSIGWKSIPGDLGI